MPLEVGYNLLCCLIMRVFVDQLSQELIGAIRSFFAYLSDTSVQMPSSTFFFLNLIDHLSK